MRITVFTWITVLCFVCLTLISTKLLPATLSAEHSVTNTSEKLLQNLAHMSQKLLKAAVSRRGETAVLGELLHELTVLHGWIAQEHDYHVDNEALRADIMREKDGKQTAMQGAHPHHHPSPRRHPRILCWVPASDTDVTSRGVHALRTWGGRCDRFLFFTSQAAVPGVPSVPLHTAETGNYDLTHKVFLALYHLYSHHLDQYDWFLKADSDTYVVVDNLRSFLAQHSPDEPVYFGHHFKPFVRHGYMSGGAGYVLSRRALARYGSRGHGSAACAGDGGTEDVQVGACMQNIGVVAGDSRDSKGRARFNCFSPAHVIHGLYPDWFTQYTKYPVTAKGLSSVSDSAISFHYVSPSLMYQLEYFIHHLRLSPQAGATGQKNSTMDSWSTEDENQYH